ncbi:MAG TPA: hypothetical protein VGA69_00715 [Nitriliruptorales bacterium]
MERRRYTAGRIRPPHGPRLIAALAHEHARIPFTLRDVRDSARRVVYVAERLQLQATLVRGALDVGGAELDHVWAVVADRVVDVPLPLRSDAFVEALRAYIAGDIEPGELERVADAYALDWRVVGEFPHGVRYYGAPFWISRAGNRPG